MVVGPFSAPFWRCVLALRLGLACAPLSLLPQGRPGLWVPGGSQSLRWLGQVCNP